VSGASEPTGFLEGRLPAKPEDTMNHLFESHEIADALLTADQAAVSGAAVIAASTQIATEPSGIGAPVIAPIEEIEVVLPNADSDQPRDQVADQDLPADEALDLVIAAEPEMETTTSGVGFVVFHASDPGHKDEAERPAAAGVIADEKGDGLAPNVELEPSHTTEVFADPAPAPAEFWDRHRQICGPMPHHPHPVEPNNHDHPRDPGNGSGPPRGEDSGPKPHGCVAIDDVIEHCGAIPGLHSSGNSGHPEPSCDVATPAIVQCLPLESQSGLEGVV
jgi:hypothetical protein